VGGRRSPRGGGGARGGGWAAARGRGAGRAPGSGRRRPGAGEGLGFGAPWGEEIWEGAAPEVARWAEWMVGWNERRGHAAAARAQRPQRGEGGNPQNWKRMAGWG